MGKAARGQGKAVGNAVEGQKSSRTCATRGRSSPARSVENSLKRADWFGPAISAARHPVRSGFGAGCLAKGASREEGQWAGGRFEAVARGGAHRRRHKRVRHDHRRVADVAAILPRSQPERELGVAHHRRADCHAFLGRKERQQPTAASLLVCRRFGHENRSDAAADTVTAQTVAVQRPALRRASLASRGGTATRWCSPLS